MANFKLPLNGINKINVLSHTKKIVKLFSTPPPFLEHEDCAVTEPASKKSSFVSALKCVLIYFVVGFFVLTGNAHAQQTTCVNHTPSSTPTEKDALIALYCATDGDSWTNDMNWLTDMPLNDWKGVTATDPNNTPNNDDDIVTLLNLSDNELTGPIPDLSALTELTSLDLNNNKLTGPMPDLSALTELTQISFAFNELDGSIPDLSTLTNLTLLYLNNNKLDGELDGSSFPTSLLHLYLRDNELTGPIPDLSTLTNLTLLYLNNNKLDGELDGSRFPTSLLILYLYGNDLTGSIPDLSTLTNLTLLYLNNNKLDGELDGSRFPTSILILNLYGNDLTGSIPDLSTLTNLTLLYLNNNKLDGELDGSSFPTSLLHLYLSDNELDGPIPEDLSTLTNLTRLYLNNNKLDGELDGSRFPTSILILNLYGNDLTGSIPDLSTLTNLTWLYLNNNGLTGPIPDLSALTNLTRLYLNNNNLDGTIPATLEQLTSLELLGLWGNEELTWETISDELGERADRAVLLNLYNSNGGEDWTNNGKWFSSDEDPFDSWYGVSTDATTGRVSELNLSNNGLKEELTNALEALDGLKELNISYNRQLTGELPLRLMDLPVETLDIRCTGVSAPADSDFQTWLSGIAFQGTCPPPPLPSPSAQPLEQVKQVMDVEVIEGVEQLSVSWEPVSEADGYKVRWKSGSQQFDSSREHTITSGDTTSYTIPGLVAGREYMVRVIATKSGADGMPSQEVAGTPSAPEPPVQQPDPDGSGGGCAIASNGVKGNTSNSVLLNLLLMGSAMFLVVSRKGR